MSNSPSPSSRMSEPFFRPDHNNNNNNTPQNTSMSSRTTNGDTRDLIPAPPPQQQQSRHHHRHHRKVVPLDHAARVYSGLAMALVIPVTITMLIIVWTLQSLGPVDNRSPAAGPSSAAAPVSSSTDPIFVVNKETDDKSTGEKIGGALLNMLIVVAAITVITFIMVILYKYGYAKILYVWLGLSAAVIFFFLSALYIDMIATRYQIPYDYIMLAIFVWNFGVTGILSVFYMGHPIMAQGYLIVVSVVVAWGLSQTPEWTTWALLVGVAIYDIVAVLCPNGPLNLLVRAAQERQEPIPGFIYDSEAGPGIELTERQRDPSTSSGKVKQPHSAPNNSNNNSDVPAPKPKQNIGNSKPGGAVASRGGGNANLDDDISTASSSAPSSPADILADDVANPLDELLGVSNNNNKNTNNNNSKPIPKFQRPQNNSNENDANYGSTTTTTNQPKPGGKPAPKPPQQQKKKAKDEDSEEEEEEDPFEAAHHASSFKLGLGDFIFYSLLVGRAAMTFEGTQTPWLVCYICIICGMGATLASLLFLRGKVPALPALPFSIFAATIAFFITRYLTLPYWDFLTLHAMMP